MFFSIGIGTGLLPLVATETVLWMVCPVQMFWLEAVRLAYRPVDKGDL